MRGLVEKRTNDAVYLVIKHGGICQESKKPREGFEQIEVPIPNSQDTVTKYVKRFDRVEALVTKIAMRDWPYEGRTFRDWNLDLDAAGIPCILQFPFSSKISRRFMKVAENIDFSQPVEFSAWLDVKDQLAFNVKQNGQKVNQLYDRENPGDCPQAVQRASGKWSHDDEEDFLYERMVNVVIPKVEAAQAGRAMQQTTEPEHGPERQSEPPDDWDDDGSEPF